MTDSVPQIPPAALADLNRRASRDASGRVTFLDDNGSPMMHLDREGCPDYTPQDVASWSRVAHPELWVSETPPAATEPAASSVEPKTMTEAMIALREGRMTTAEASAAIARIAGSSTTTAHVSTSPASQSMTALMISARKGDAAALEALQSYIR